MLFLILPRVLGVCYEQCFQTAKTEARIYLYCSSFGAARCEVVPVLLQPTVTSRDDVSTALRYKSDSCFESHM
jgi:hypothetical protein